MESKYNYLRESLKKHMQDANGPKAWNKYYGSQLEADIIYFIEKILASGSYYCFSEEAGAGRCKCICDECKSYKDNQ